MQTFVLDPVVVDQYAQPIDPAVGRRMHMLNQCVCVSVCDCVCVCK